MPPAQMLAASKEQHNMATVGDARIAATTTSESQSMPALVFDASSIKLEGTEDPRNWSGSRKWFTSAIISLMGFISPLGSSILVPGTGLLDRTFHLNSRELSLLPISFFVLGLGIGPFLLAPASELHGRQPIYLISSAIFVLFNVGTATVNTFAGLCILRFLAGAAGSTGPSLGAGSIGDMFLPSERGRAQSMYGLGPLLGPVCGAIAGGWVTEDLLSWRWQLWILTILSGSITVVIGIFLRETYGPVLLQKKVQRLARGHLAAIDASTTAGAGAMTEAQQQHRAAVHRIAHPNETPTTSTINSTPASDFPRRRHHRFGRLCLRLCLLLFPSKVFRAKLKMALKRPFRLLFTNPICAIFSLYMGFLYGIIFIFITQHPLLYKRRTEPDDPPPQKLPTYDWDPGNTSLTYLGLGLGFLVAAAINVVLQDLIYTRLTLNHGCLDRALFFSHDEDILKHAAQRADREKSLSDPLEQDQDVEAAGTTDTQIVASSASTEPKDIGTATGRLPPTTQHAQPVPLALAGAPSMGIPVPMKGRPEFRLPLCLVGMIILPCGLLVFGWTATKHTHWAVPLVGSFLVGVGSILPFQVILVYLVDAFIPFSASATACAVLVRCILAAAFPLFSKSLFVGLGFGWGSSLLALVAALAIPIPIVLWWRGEALRTRFKFEG